MKKAAFRKRILCDGQVYLLVKDCVNILGVDSIDEYVKDEIEINSFGRCITEDEFNRILKHFPDSPAVTQVTRYDTLDLHIKDIIDLYPFKLMFAKELFEEQAMMMNMSVDDYIDKIDFPNELKREEEKLKCKKTFKEKIRKYQLDIKKGINAVNNIPFEKYGLTLQHLTVIEKDIISFKTYYAGDGIFWWVMPDQLGDDVWEEANVTEDGTILVPSPDYGDGYLKLPKIIERDFRQFSVMDNIMYCLQNLEGKDEWTDSVTIREDGVNIEISKTFLMKLINQKNCRNVYYIEGIPQQ